MVLHHGPQRRDVRVDCLRVPEKRCANDLNPLVLCVLSTVGHEFERARGETCDQVLRNVRPLDLRCQLHELVGLEVFAVARPSSQIVLLRELHDDLVVDAERVAVFACQHPAVIDVLRVLQDRLNLIVPFVIGAVQERHVLAVFEGWQQQALTDRRIERVDDRVRQSRVFDFLLPILRQFEPVLGGED